MKKPIAILMAAWMVASLAGCAGNQPTPDEEICPGKQLGEEGTSPVPAEGFDTTVDMSFTTVDTDGNAVTNEVFAGSERGVWLVFWRTDNDKSAAELARLQRMLPIAEENGYKIVGIVMDGESNQRQAEEMTKGLDFVNIHWNDEVASRYEGISKFFTKGFFEENKEQFEQLPVLPELGEPVTTYTNSRGQIQSSCTFVTLSDETLEAMWKSIDGNATFEELQAQNQAALNK